LTRLVVEFPADPLPFFFLSAKQVQGQL
jgi:hypothetical protein